MHTPCSRSGSSADLRNRPHREMIGWSGESRVRPGGGAQVTAAEIIAGFLDVCPGIGPAWREHLECWAGNPERGIFNDAAVIARHIVDSFERGDVSEFPAVFALLERCLAEGDDTARELAVVGIIEDIQNIATHRHFGPRVFCAWLGPESQAAWDELCGFWQGVADSKASGLLGAGQPVDPSQIKDAALRRELERLLRK
jgi:hypothetical protein